jgi:hypothetical protein
LILRNPARRFPGRRSSSRWSSRGRTTNCSAQSGKLVGFTQRTSCGSCLRYRFGRRSFRSTSQSSAKRFSHRAPTSRLLFEQLLQRATKLKRIHGNVLYLMVLKTHFFGCIAP